MRHKNKEDEYVRILDTLIGKIRQDQKDMLAINATPVQIAENINDLQKVIGVIISAIEEIKEI